MILTIYKIMLENAQAGLKTPKYITHVFYIDNLKSKEFWINIDNSIEHDILYKEWDRVDENKYSKVFYGIKYEIHFNY